MKRVCFVAVAVCLMFGASPSHAKVIGQEVEYRDNGLVMKGFLAYKEEVKTKMPGVLVVHEWWGHNEYARKRARMPRTSAWTPTVTPSCSFAWA